MTDVVQELMTPPEAARWFRRSPSWLRRQQRLLRVGESGAQPLYHVCVCRAYLLGLISGLEGEELDRVQRDALAAACGLRARISPRPSTARQSAANPPNAKTRSRPVAAAQALAQAH